MKLNTGEYAAFPAATVEGWPKLFKRTCVLSNLNFKISFGPAYELFQTVSGKLQVGQLELPVVVGVTGVGCGSSSFFLQENTTAEIITKTMIFFILVNLTLVKRVNWYKFTKKLCV